MNKWIRIAIILLLFAVLVLIRAFQESLFYDPLLEFYKSDYLRNVGLPEMNIEKTIGYTGLRFLINSLISLIILFVAFRDRGLVRFATLLYLIAFVVLIVAFWILLHHYNPERYMSLFYVRRFLMQPLLIIILLPAFYYQKRKER